MVGGVQLGLPSTMLLLCFLTWSSSATATASKTRSDQVCGGTSNSSVTSLTSPEFPARYPPGLRCSWIIESPPSACSFTINLGDLRLPPCPSDLLVVGGVQLCGDPSRVLQLPLLSFRTNITFRGDPRGGQGFNITVQQIKCRQLVNQVLNRQGNSEYKYYSCGGEFYGETVVIESPGYPSSYPPDAHCRYTIRRASEEVCQVEVTFENSSLEYSENCYKDRLEIQGDHLCGEIKGISTFSIGRALEISFVSDSEGSSTGFKFTARQIKCSDTSIVVDASEENDKQDVLVDCGPQGTVNVPPLPDDGYPRVRRPYPPFTLPGEDIINHPFSYNQPQEEFRENPMKTISSESFNLRFPSRYPPHLEPFNKYNFQKGPTSPDLLRPIYQKPNSYNANIPKPYHKINIPPLFRTPFSQIQQCCEQVYNGNHFLIVSPGFPRSQASDCVYTIQRYSPLTFQLRLQFRFFWEGQDSGDGCIGGALEIDGNRICGCKTGIVWTSQFVDSETVKILHLRSESLFNRLFNGFVIEVYQDDFYSGKYKKRDTSSSSEVVNVTQYVETFVETEPLGIQLNGHQLLDRTNGQLQWDPSRQTWTLPSDLFCLRWSYQDWILLAKETLWSQYQCPVAALGATDGTRFELTACRTCNYFCRQNCQCC